MASWIGNWELDVAVDDQRFTEEMARMYLEDLETSAEIVLKERRIVDRRAPRTVSTTRRRVGSAGRFAAGAVRLGNTASAMITEHRLLGPAEARAAAMLGGACVIVAILALLWPPLVAIPLGLVVAWIGGAMLAKAHALRKQREESGAGPMDVVETGSETA
jgi:cardiolipin synthase